MSPFEVYQSYLSLKSHFSNPKYDYFKYNKKVRASVTSFNARADKYFFEKSSRKYNDKEIVDFLVSNFIAADNPQSIWIGHIINSGERIYQEWMRRQQSLTYLFKEQSTALFSGKELKSVFDCSKGHPIILKTFLRNDVSIENMVIYDTIFSFCEEYDKKLIDPIWEMTSLKIKKYRPFIHIDIFYYKKLLRDIINE